MIRSSNASRAPGPRPAVLLALLVLGCTVTTQAITLTGSNGRAVEFVGIKDATPKGLTAKVGEEAPLLGIPWEKLDLAALQQEHPEIHAAYLATQRGETVALNLGTFDTSPEMADSPAAPPKRDRFPGWVDTEVAGGVYAMQLPAGEPRAILLVSAGGMGRSLDYFTGFELGTGQFAELQTKGQVALLSYQFDYRDRDPRKMPDFAYADRGTGQAIIEAVAKIAAKAGRPELNELPFLVYGSERTGATLAYSLVHWKPEKILGAVMVKGGFYDAPPTEASVRIPILFMWGAYGNQTEIWGTEATAQKVLAEAAPMAPNWTGAPEFRGGDELNRGTDYFTNEYLMEILELRLVDENGEAEGDDAATGDGEEDNDAADGEAAEEEGDETPSPADGASARIRPLDRGEGYIGTVDVEEFEYRKIDDPDAALGENETFLPTLDIARRWEEYGEGTLEAPE